MDNAIAGTDQLFYLPFCPQPLGPSSMWLLILQPSAQHPDGLILCLFLPSLSFLQGKGRQLPSFLSAVPNIGLGIEEEAW
jgi:hypothetical protein